MIRLSVKVSDHLHQQLVEKGRQMGVDNVSDAVRILLLMALKNEEGSSSALVNRATSDTVMVRCLIEESLLSLVESGAKIRDKAHAKAEKLIAELEEKS